MLTVLHTKKAPEKQRTRVFFLFYSVEMSIYHICIVRRIYYIYFPLISNIWPTLIVEEWKKKYSFHLFASKYTCIANASTWAPCFCYTYIQWNLKFSLLIWIQKSISLAKFELHSCIIIRKKKYSIEGCVVMHFRFTYSKNICLTFNIIQKRAFFRYSFE